MSEPSRDEATAAPDSFRRRQIRRILPLALIVVFAQEKLDFDPVALDDRRTDGLFYYQIAQHVAAGDGLLTSVSLYGQGLRELPAPTTVQPLWPLMLGWTGRAIGLPRAAAWLPETIYFVSLVLLYLLANRIGRVLDAEILLSLRGVPVLDLGTVSVAILGANSVYRAYTSLAYSEGLAMALLFGAILALPTPGTRRTLVRAGLAGLLAGLAYLARSQLILVPLAISLALVLVAVRETALRRAALACVAGALVPVAAWIAFLVNSLGALPPAVLVSFFAHRETPELPEFSLAVEYDGFLDRALDILGSFAVAFDPFGSESYVASFGPVVYAVPLAAALLMRRLVRGPGIPAGIAQAPGVAGLPVLAACLVAAAALAPVHVAHMAIWIEWHFGWRHGLPLILALIPAIAVLMRTGSLLRALTLAAVVAGIAAPATRPANYTEGNQLPTWPAEQSLVRWLDQQPRRPVLLAAMARSLAARSQAVAHQLDCGGPDDVRRQLELLPVDYLVVYATDLRRCPELAKLGAPDFVRVKRFGAGTGQISVLELPRDRFRPDRQGRGAGIRGRAFREPRASATLGPTPISSNDAP